MIIILLIVLVMISISLGVMGTVVFFRRLERQFIRQYKGNCKTYKQVLDLIMKDLQVESNFRKNVEEKLQSELQVSHELHRKLIVSEERLKLLDHYSQKYEKVNNELHNQLNLNHNQALRLKELDIRFEEYKLSMVEKEKLLVNNENRLSIQFENLANRILDQNRHKINEQNRLTLDRVLDPFREQLNGFKNQIQDTLSKEQHVRHTLSYEIHNLCKLNAKITQETANLTQALKGNNKIQGNWGEMILVRALEASGMREGHEFHFQMNIKQMDGRKFQPDVVVHLPNGKDIVIDSKISLISYERYFNSDNEQTKHIAITEHIQSLRTHIKLLSKKDYQQLLGSNTLDYVLMFIPIESAFAIALEKEPSLLTESMNCNIMLVSPTTLLVALRTINNLWQHEHQNCYAKKIAEKAGRLYDKLRLFVDDLSKIGQFLNKVEIVYKSATNKFFEGKGNIISQVEGFRKLGVQIKHPIISDVSMNNTSLFSESKDENNVSEL